MTYEEWFLKQGELHANVMKKLVDKSDDEVILFILSNILHNFKPISTKILFNIFCSMWNDTA